MRGIISRPESPVTGFLKGAGATFAMVGIPLVGRTLFMGANLIKSLEVSVAIVLVISLIAGCAMAVWQLLQGLAYDQIADEGEGS